MSLSEEPVKKEKKTRRRLRLSCVECTKRRQRCDRAYPCGLCVSRGVSHLCRWENVPVARPAPARPPVMPTSAVQDHAIQQLTAQIASLEQALLAERSLRNSTLMGSSPHSSNGGLPVPVDFSPRGSVASLRSTSNGTSPYSSPEPYPQDEEEVLLLPPLPDEVWHVAAGITQQTLAHYGEFVGEGSVMSALYGMSSKTMPRLPHCESANPSVLFASIAPDHSPNPSLDRLVQYLPPSATIDALCRLFFQDLNWRFGIPAAWFHTACAAMNALRHSHRPYINPNWLCLLFAVLALVSGSTGNESAERLFSCAMEARKIAEDLYLAQPDGQPWATQGSVLLALATPLLCDYLAERGNLSAAWKLVGQAVVSAEALGLHRDPDWPSWHNMTDDEKLLRRRAWWGLFNCERLLSLLLGRPSIVRVQSDVMRPPLLNSDGIPDSFNAFQAHLLQLFELTGEVSDKCFGPTAPTSSIAHGLDRRLEKWNSQLPAELRSDIPPGVFSDVDRLALARQRHWLTTCYLLCRAKLHVAFHSNDADFISTWERPLSRNHSRRLTVKISSDLIRLQCDILARRRQQTRNDCSFIGCFSLLEGAITLASLQDSDPLVEQAMLLLSQLANEDPTKGTIARLGSEALEALIHARVQGGFDQFSQEYAWYSGNPGFAPTSPTKDPTRFNMDLEQLLMYDSESKVRLLDTFDTRMHA